MACVQFSKKEGQINANVTFNIEGTKEFATADLLADSHQELIQTIDAVWIKDWFDYDQYIAKLEA